MKVETYAVVTDGHIAGFDYPLEGRRMPANRVLMTPELLAKWEAAMAQQAALAEAAEAKQEPIESRLKYDGADFSVPVKAK